MFDLEDNDIAALQAIRNAMMACNAAFTPHLQHQVGGTFGFMHDGFLDAATALIGTDGAEQLMYYLIDTGDSVTWCLNTLRQDFCGVCEKRIDDLSAHCSECGVCVGTKHSANCSEIACLGHQTLDGPAGITAYCRDECRPAFFTGEY